MVACIATTVVLRELARAHRKSNESEMPQDLGYLPSGFKYGLLWDFSLCHKRDTNMSKISPRLGLSTIGSLYVGEMTALQQHRSSSGDEVLFGW